uniref:Ovule protein n=1 Tax=Caenorhabditis tropicalis TaxID=1561998 RepID=A0A1I7T8B7_9PELO
MPPTDSTIYSFATSKSASPKNAACLNNQTIKSTSCQSKIVHLSSKTFAPPTKSTTLINSASVHLPTQSRLLKPKQMATFRQSSYQF